MRTPPRDTLDDPGSIDIQEPVDERQIGGDKIMRTPPRDTLADPGSIDMLVSVDETKIGGDKIVRTPRDAEVGPVTA